MFRGWRFLRGGGGVFGDLGDPAGFGVEAGEAVSPGDGAGQQTRAPVGGMNQFGGCQLVPDTTARRPVTLVDRLGAPSGQLLDAVNVPSGLPAV